MESDNVARSLAAARRLDESLHAFSQLFDVPLQAGRADRAFVAKDNFDVCGLATYAGSRQPVIAMATKHAEAVDRFIRAGFALLGRTRMPQLAYGGSGASQIEPTPINPRDPRVERLPGGSSSGSAVAVAAGIIDIALGTDTGGSVRIPASLCGVVGFKPARTTFPIAGVFPLAPSLDTVGVLTRDVAAAQECWQLLRDRTGLGDSHATNLPAAGRIAVARLDPSWECPPAVRGVLEMCAEALRETGHAVQTVTLPWDPLTIYASSSVVLGYEAWHLFGHMLDDPEFEFDPVIARRLRSGSSIGAADYAAALGQRERDQHAQHQWLESFDALMLPTTPVTAPAVGSCDENSAILSRFTRAGTWLDVPAISLPAGHDTQGLPVGIQLMTHPQREQQCLEIAATLESASPVTPLLGPGATQHPRSVATRPSPPPRREG